MRAILLAWVMGSMIAFAAQPSASPSPPPLDLDAALKEFVSTLVDFVKIDTTTHETRGAQFLKAILDKEGIPSELIESSPGHGNIIARLKGNGTKRPLMLLGHIDVVGVEPEKWSVDPFGAIVKDGVLYGRGSRDDKAMTVADLVVFIALHRQKIPLDRDIIYVAEAGEEGAPQLGIEYLVKNHWDKIDCEYALNEGGAILERPGQATLFRISTAEKVPRPLLLTAKGTSGHGSRPRPDNPIVHLAAAIAKLGDWQPPIRLNETTREYFKRLAAVSSPEEASLFRNIENPAMTAGIQEQFRLADLTHNSVIRTTISPNIIRGGFRSNVIPGDATATLDIRALPDEDMTSLINTLNHLFNDPAITISELPAHRSASAPMPLDSELFKAMERVQKRILPTAVTIPFMQTGATDSAQLRAKGVKAYGIGAVGTEEEGATIHGNDERIRTEPQRQFLDFLWQTVLEMSAAQK